MNVARTFLETGQEVMGVATLTQIITEAEQANDKECLIAAYRLRGTALLKWATKPAQRQTERRCSPSTPNRHKSTENLKPKERKRFP